MGVIRALAALIMGEVISILSAPVFADLPVPTPDHVVVVVMENHSFSEIIDSSEAPFIADLAKQGAIFTHSFAVAHPSQPNYFALFSGSTHGITDNNVYALHAPTLAGALRTAGKSFVGYVEQGSPRKHRPWQTFADAQGVEQNLAAFPSDFTKLPTISFVIPNNDHDMHDGSIEQGDAWLKRHLGPYAEWCATHNDLFILTFDEDNGRENNQILTLLVGGSVKPGQYDERVTHYRLLRTLEAMHGVSPLGHRTAETPITYVWHEVSH
jgi:phosphatidylinositol-3-phosphatase